MSDFGKYLHYFLNSNGKTTRIFKFKANGIYNTELGKRLYRYFGLIYFFDDVYLLMLDDDIVGIITSLENKIFCIEIIDKYRNSGLGKYFLSFIEKEIFKDFNNIVIEHVLNYDFFLKNGYMFNGDCYIKNRKWQ